MSRPVVALTTDFGMIDGYVGTMKGVVLGICPEVVLVDISHDIEPQGIQQAAYVLHTASPYFPEGTVHLIVVDPGVGGARRPIVVQTERATFVAPDNGVLGFVMDGSTTASAYHLTNPLFRLPRVSDTFHGRDIFAPAAAHLSCGVPPHALGDPLPLSDLALLPSPQLVQPADGMWQGEILHIDRFGNLVTTFRAPLPLHLNSIRIKDEHVVGLSRTFSDVKTQELVAYLGSGSYLEIGVRDGNAAVSLDVRVGDAVFARATSPDSPSSGECQGDP